jgi:hypothetical protein
MKKIVLTYGLIAGFILAAFMAVMVPLATSGRASFENAEVVGYSSMVLAFVAVFLGIRSYREKNGGTITFGRALGIGLLITLITSVIYVTTWEVIYWNFLPDFADKYAAFSIAKLQAKGAPAAEIAKARADMAQFKVLYKNPLFNIGMTFVEVFPVGFLMTLISAAILRRKSPNAPAVAVAA